MPTKSNKRSTKKTFKSNKTATKSNSSKKSYVSPFASSFNSAINRGTSFNVAVQNIAKRNNKSFNFVCESLYKGGCCFRQKIAGQWIYWPCNGKKTNATQSKMCQATMWQWYVDWCICNGFCTPEQMKNQCGGQADFMNWCKKFFGKQFSTPSSATTNRPRKSVSKKRTTTHSRSRTTSSRSYKFPKSNSRRVRSAA